MSELQGIIKNGIQRGWPAQEIAQSLINSGYSPQEIQIELSKYSSNQTIPPQIPTQPGQKLAPYQIPETQEKKSANKFVVILLIVLATLAIAGAIGLILYRQSLA
jgi:hypothetical protein